MKVETISFSLVKMINHKHLRKVLEKRIDRYIYKSIVEAAGEDLKMVRQRRYEFLSAMLKCTMCNVDKGYISDRVIRNISSVFVQNNLIDAGEDHLRTVERYKARYGELPPTFIVFSPTQRCNLNCIGCYAGSNSHTAATLPFDYVDRIVGETHDIFGSRFMTISGGEPFMYKSDGKTLLDIFEKYSDMFFLVYTNGTLINDEIVERLSEAANVTPAISVEGFEAETDARRGEGVYKRILNTFSRLRSAGVPFGVSVTATSANNDVLLSDEFYDYYFLEQGVSYMWQFQLMPIGRGKDQMRLMVSPSQRLELYRKWEELLGKKGYCVADFWNSGVLSRGCIAYGRSGGYFYIDWAGNITPARR